MYFGAPSRFSEGWGISLKLAEQFVLLLDPPENKKVNKHFKIQRQLQYSTTRPNDMILTLVCNVITMEQLQFTVYHENLTRAA